jgi:hypothetical protein
VVEQNKVTKEPWDYFSRRKGRPKYEMNGSDFSLHGRKIKKRIVCLLSKDVSHGSSGKLLEKLLAG